MKLQLNNGTIAFRIAKMEVSTLVIDNGGYMIHAGVGGEREPSCIIPSVVGSSKVKHTQSAAPPTIDYFVGTDVLNQEKPQTLSCPITNRVITNFDEMKHLWEYVFTNLKANPEERPILMTESPQNPKQAREKTIEIIMEEYKVPAYYTTYPEVLSLYSTGSTTGCVIDAGESVTDILPVFECFGMTHVQSRLDIGGKHINDHLRKLLLQSGTELHGPRAPQIIRDIKEKMCYVALDMEAESQKIGRISEIDRTFETPDGQSLKLSVQRFRCPEPFFDPQLVQVPQPGLVEMITGCIGKTDDLKPQMYGNILLTGGSSMFDGFAERIEHDLNKVVPQGTQINVVAPPNRKYAAWIGGSMLVSLATFSQMWITKAEYDETGNNIVHLKCF